MNHSFENDFKRYDDLNKSIEDLYILADQITRTTEGELNMVMEADALIPQVGVLSKYFEESNKGAKKRIAVESIRTGLVDMFTKLYEYIVEMLKKFIDWITSFFKRDGFKGTSKQVEALEHELKDPEFVKALTYADEVIAEMGSSVATEEAVGYYGGRYEAEDTGTGISVNKTYDDFRNSLSDAEVDFITSGHRYKAIKDVVEEYSKGHFAEFIGDFSNSIRQWTEEGLFESPHVGRDEDVVNKFKLKRVRRLNEIRDAYQRSINAIDEMEHRSRNQPPKGDFHHLSMFKKKPSILFPHLERIWSSIKFERISDADKKLIGSLEKLRRQFETDIRQITSKLENDDQNWPAEETVMKLSREANREILKYITSLIGVGHFIKQSANIAYHATLKSLGYITKILNAIGKLPNVDRAKLNKCLDVIYTKRSSLDKITTIA